MEARQHEERRRPRFAALGVRRRQPTTTRDATTGLMNGAAFEVVATHALGRAARLGAPSVLVCFAVPVPAEESELGMHRRLRETARRLVEATRGEDVLGRTGPRELCALLPGVDEDDAGLVAERLAALEVAVGVAAGSAATCDVRALLADARAEASRSLKLAE